jgi:hypothetical protein
MICYDFVICISASFNRILRNTKGLHDTYKLSMSQCQPTKELRKKTYHMNGFMKAMRERRPLTRDATELYTAEPMTIIKLLLRNSQSLEVRTLSHRTQITHH